jgi:hypothetical protein
MFVVPGQNSPTSFRQLRFFLTSGKTGVPSANFTVTRNVSFARPPDLWMVVTVVLGPVFGALAALASTSARWRRPVEV